MKRLNGDGSLLLDLAVIAAILLIPISVGLFFWFNCGWFLLLAVPSLLMLMAG